MNKNNFTPTVAIVNQDVALNLEKDKTDCPCPIGIIDVLKLLGHGDFF